LKTTVLIADDHQIFREGLRALLQSQTDTEVLDEAADGHTIVKLTRKKRPSIVLMDVAMPGLNGIDATRKITSQDPEMKVLALSMHNDKRYVLEMLRAGAAGYLLKDCAFTELRQAIRTVLGGHIYLSPDVNDIFIRDYIGKESHTARNAVPVLGGREREVLQLLAEGANTKEIAQLLDISAKTVESHRKNLMDKLNLHTVAELTKYALREGLTTLDR